MSYLLDTNVLIYSLCSPSRLSQDARRIVSTDPNVSVSIVSFWEIAIKQGLGKLNINSTIPQIERICLMRNIKSANPPC